MSIVFLADLVDLKQYETTKNLLLLKNVPFTEKLMKNDIKRIKVENIFVGRLTMGVSYGKKGAHYFYYLVDGSFIKISNCYGFSGRGQPHTRSTRIEIFNKDGNRNREAEKSFDYNPTTFVDKTVAQMGKILQENQAV